MKNKNLSEKEIDEIIIAQATDEEAWDDIKDFRERDKGGSPEKSLKP